MTDESQAGERRRIPNEGMWIVSTDPECWYPQYEWGSKELAIQFAAGELGLQPGETFYVGQVEMIPIEGHKFFDGAVLIDMARENIDERVGEDAAQEFLEKATPDMEQDLEVRFKDVFLKWMADHNLTPRFFNVNAQDDPCVIPEDPDGNPDETTDDGDSDEATDDGDSEVEP